jgi:uncharacterized protein
MKLSNLIFVSFITAGIHGFSQDVRTDISLIKNKNYYAADDKYYEGAAKINNKEPIEFKHKSFISKYNPVSLAATAMMLLYQNVVSPQLSRHCLYQRTCSNFSKESISEFGLIKGVFLSADRLLRCNTTAIEDVPADKFDTNNHAIDEPESYHIRKK